MTDGPSFLYEKLVYEKLGKRNLYTSRTQNHSSFSYEKNMADDRDDEEF